MYAVAANMTSGVAGGSAVSGWEARLKLGFSHNGVKTLLSERSHHGPLTVQRPFYPEGGVCHVYLLHPPGGIVAGDRLSIDVHVAAGSEALLTTPAAGKFYRSAGLLARQNVNLKIESGAALEWLPQESIVYEGAKLDSGIHIELEQDARLIAWEILAFGRPAAGEGFNVGEALLRWRITRDERPLYLEAMGLDAEAFAARWGLNGHSVCGTLFACSATTKQRDKVREMIGDAGGRGVTLIDDLLICRAVDHKTEPLRQFFEQVRNAIRADIVKREKYTPRIWAT